MAFLASRGKSGNIFGPQNLGTLHRAGRSKLQKSIDSTGNGRVEVHRLRVTWLIGVDSVEILRDCRIDRTVQCPLQVQAGATPYNMEMGIRNKLKFRKALPQGMKIRSSGTNLKKQKTEWPAFQLHSSSLPAHDAHPNYQAFRGNTAGISFMRRPLHRRLITHCEHCPSTRPSGKH
jgi:hypothetical protein